jgi:zinc protease
VSAADGGGPDRTRAPRPGALRPFRFPEVHRHTLSNGLKVLASEMRDFPVVTVSLTADAGALADDPEKAGVSALVSALLESGAGGKTADEIAELVDGLGVSLDSSIAWDTVQVGFTALTSRMEEAGRVLADVALRPEFPQDEVDRLRDERLALLRQRRGTPANLADEVESLYAYAPGVPFARPMGGSAETVARLTRDDLAAFHAARYRPSTAAVVAAGDASIDEIVALAERCFGGWEGEAPPRTVPDVRPRLDRTTIVIADRPGAVQSELRVAHVGIERTSPDYFAVTVMNSLLGGTFSSRLNLNLRERLGYTYGAFSSFLSRRQRGLFSMSAAVQTEVTAHSVSEMLRELRELQEAPVTPAELDDARNFLAGIFPLSLETTDGVAGRLQSLVTYGLPDDYWDHYRDGILSVTAEDVLEAARRHLWPDRAAVVIAGDAEAIRGPLEELGIGPVEVVDPATLP